MLGGQLAEVLSVSAVDDPSALEPFLQLATTRVENQSPVPTNG
jgi:hypothetical protein